MTTPAQRPKYLGLIGAAAGVAFTVGPGLGAAADAALAAGGVEKIARSRIIFYIATFFCALAWCNAYRRLVEPARHNTHERRG